MTRLLYLLSIILFVSCSSSSQGNRASTSGEKATEEEKLNYFLTKDGKKIDKITKSEDEWKSELNDMEYYVLRKKGTERSFTSDLLNIKEDGVFTCGACNMPLFETSTKFKSGTGWPSFYQPIQEEFILRDVDYNIGYERTEVMCNRCEGHLGHVFKDGPEPTGLRYCINGVSLNFEKGKKSEDLIQLIVKSDNLNP